jgi:drug/metabolite transporter (DMT)-like permease
MSNAWIRYLTPWIAPIFVIIWSTGFIIARYGMPHAEPMTFLSLRFLGVLICMIPIVLLWKAPWPRQSQIIHIAIAGILLQAGYLGGVWAAVREGMSAGLTALIVGLQPILTALLASWVAERVRPVQWLGLVIGLLGVGLVVWAKIVMIGFSDLSFIFIIIALLAITAGTLYQKKYCPQFDLRTGSVIQFAASAVVCVPLMMIFETREIAWVPELIFSLLWSIFALSIGASSLLFVMIRHGAATKVTSLMYLTPPLTALIAWVLFDETLSITGALGMLLAVVGVAFVVRK